MKLFFSLLFLSILFACSSEKKYKPVNSLSDILENIQPQQQSKEIDATADNFIQGENGTQVYIPSNTLQFEDGSTPKSNVQIVFTEAYNNADFISNRISTLSDSIILETGGMIYLTATADGKKLRIAKDKSLVIAFPKKDSLKRMETFYGEKNKEGNITWQPAISGSEGSSIEPAFSSDSSLYTYKFHLCGFLYSCNDEPIEWKINHPDSTLFNYVSKRLVVPDSIIVKYRKDIAATPMRIKVIKGKITSVLFDSSYTPNPFKSIVTRFLKEAPTIPLTSKQICPFENDGYYLQLCYSKSIDSAKFSERFQQKYTQYRKKAIAEIDPDELNYYIISSSQLGWINCDRFIDLKEEKIDYLVQVPQGNNTQLQLVFGNIKSVMQGEQKGNGFIFRNVPLNRKVTLMAISYLNKRPSLCHAQTFISKTPYQLKDFKEFTLSELELALKKL